MYIIHSNNQAIATRINQKINGKLSAKNNCFIIDNNELIDLNEFRNEFLVDINFLDDSVDMAKFKVFVSDMDSTLINIECIDEIADFANIKPQVASITEMAMAGKLDFNESLKSRVALLKNLDKSVLQKVYDEKLQINFGGVELISFLHNNNIITAVVSGGFDFFTSKLKQKLNLNYELANKLEIINNKLSGNTIGDIVNADSKANFIDNLLIDNDKVITCGDGANDLKMMEKSGLSIAYHAKEVVNNYADIVIKYGGLNKIIDLF